MPHITPTFFVLLADSRAFPKAGEQARPDAQLITPEFYVLFALVVLVIGVVAGVKKYNSRRERRDRNYPWGVFHELCRAHGLSRSERRVLTKLARSQKLTHPAVVFVDPSPLAAQTTGAAEQLRAKLFGGF